MRPFVPPPWLQRFVDWTVEKCTVYEPEKLDIKYDYWFSGFVVGVLLHAFVSFLWGI